MRLPSSLPLEQPRPNLSQKVNATETLTVGCDGLLKNIVSHFQTAAREMPNFPGLPVPTTAFGTMRHDAQFMQNSKCINHLYHSHKSITDIKLTAGSVPPNANLCDYPSRQLATPLQPIQPRGQLTENIRTAINIVVFVLILNRGAGTRVTFSNMMQLWMTCTRSWNRFNLQTTNSNSRPKT